MAYTGNSSKAVSSSFLYSTLQTFYTKIKGLLDNKADKTALNSINPNTIAGGYTKNSFYINTHPENSGAIIPFINNDIAFLLKRGGSAKIYYDDVEKSLDISNVFDGSPSYWAIDPTGVTKIVIELTLHKTFTWTNTVYVDFGSAGWRAKSVSIDVMNTDNSETTWTNKSTITNNSIGEHKITFTHNDGKGFNKIRFTFTDWAHTTIFRISCLGVVNYGSSGLRETFLPKDGGSVYGAITPYSNNSIDLGSSSSKWKNIYATTFNGALSGNASTSTKATQDSAGQQINTTYIKGLSVSGKTITYTKGDNTTGTITTQDTNTTYSNATTSTAGLMSANDKSKLDGIASGANAYTLPTASSSTLGGVKTTSTVTSNSGYTACPIISGVPYYKDTNTTYTLSSFGVTATSAELNVLDGITATVTELNYCDGVTSNIQTQINTLNSSLDDCFQSVSDGKTLVANAITDKGVNTDTSSTFATMASNIGKIKIGIDTSAATANASTILTGYSAYVKGNKINGSMPNRDTLVSDIGGMNTSYPSLPLTKGSNLQITTPTVAKTQWLALQPPNGYYSGGNYIGVPLSDVASVTGASANKILSGNTICGVAGSIANQAAYTASHSVVTDSTHTYIRIPKGAYLAEASNGLGLPEVTATNAQIANAIGLTSGKLLSGNTVCGVSGTALSGKGYYENTFAAGSYTTEDLGYNKVPSYRINTSITEVGNTYYFSRISLPVSLSFTNICRIVVEVTGTYGLIRSIYSNPAFDESVTYYQYDGSANRYSAKSNVYWVTYNPGGGSYYILNNDFSRSGNVLFTQSNSRIQFPMQASASIISGASVSVKVWGA